MAKFSQRQKAGQGHGRKDTGSCSVSASQLKTLLWSLILLKSFSQNVVLMLSEALVASEVCKMLKSAVKQDSFFFFFSNLLVLGLHCGSKASPVTTSGLGCPVAYGVLVP